MKMAKKKRIEKNEMLDAIRSALMLLVCCVRSWITVKRCPKMVKMVTDEPKNVNDHRPHHGSREMVLFFLAIFIGQKSKYIIE